MAARPRSATPPANASGEAFKIEGLGIALMEKLDGRDYTSLIGLPQRFAQDAAQIAERWKALAGQGFFTASRLTSGQGHVYSSGRVRHLRPAYVLLMPKTRSAFL